MEDWIIFVLLFSGNIKASEHTSPIVWEVVNIVQLCGSTYRLDTSGRKKITNIPYTDILYRSYTF